jgi:ligand-binding sensor domain-containing protein
MLPVQARLVFIALAGLSCSPSNDGPDLTLHYSGLSVLSLTETSVELWIGSDDGLIIKNRISGDTVRYSPLNSPLTTYSIRTMITDDSGAVWISNGSQGLLRYWKDSWTAFPVDSGLPGSSIVDLEKSASGFLIASGTGIGRYQDGRFSILSPPPTTTYGGSVTAVAEAENGDLWVGTWGGGLLQITGSVWKKWTPANSPLRTFFVFDVAPSPDGSVWIGEGGGLAQYHSGSWKQYNSVNSGLPQNDVTAVELRRPDEIWIGMYVGGLAILKDRSEWTSYRPMNSVMPSDRVYSIFKTASGTFWIGTPLGLVQIRP